MSIRDPAGRPTMGKEPFEEDPIEEVRRVLSMRVRSETPTAECPDDDTIAALAAGTLTPELRASSLPHVASCPRCRATVASVARALADSAVVREVAAVDGAGRRRFTRFVVPAAAAAALVLLVAWPREADDGGGHRGGGAVVPVPVSPIGAVAGARSLLWSAVTGSDRYRVTLFDANGRVLYETQLPDTQAALPDSITLTPGRPYLWQVEARTGFDRWAASALVEFRIAAEAPR